MPSDLGSDSDYSLNKHAYDSDSDDQCDRKRVRVSRSVSFSSDCNDSSYMSSVSKNRLETDASDSVTFLYTSDDDDQLTSDDDGDCGELDMDEQGLYTLYSKATCLEQENVMSTEDDSTDDDMFTDESEKDASDELSDSDSGETQSDSEETLSMSEDTTCPTEYECYAAETAISMNEYIKQDHIEILEDEEQERLIDELIEKSMQRLIDIRCQKCGETQNEEETTAQRKLREWCLKYVKEDDNVCTYCLRESTMNRLDRVGHTESEANSMCCEEDAKAVQDEDDGEAELNNCYITDDEANSAVEKPHEEFTYMYSSAHVKARVENTTLEIMVDSGANVGIIHTDTLRTIQKKSTRRIEVQTSPRLHSGSVVAADGGAMRVVGITWLNITVQSNGRKCQKKCRFCVVANGTKTILLGTDTLHQMGAVVDFPQQKLHVNNGKISVPMRITKKVERQNGGVAFKVYCQDTVGFPDIGTARKITVALNDGKFKSATIRGTIVTDSVIAARKNLKIANNITTMVDGEADVMVACFQCDGAEIHRGMLMGWFIPMSTEEELNVCEIDLDLAFPDDTPLEAHAATANEEEILSQLRENEPEERHRREWTEEEKNKLIRKLELEKINNITAAERQMIVDLMKRNADRFDLEEESIGRTWVYHHRIDTIENAHPQKSAPYRESPEQRKVMKDFMERFLKKGFISPIISEWAAPSLLVAKKSGKWRLVIDYRKLNSVVKKHVYVMPRVDDNLDAIGGCKYFSTFDASDGYHQIPLASEDDRRKSAFINSQGTFAWNVCPQGEANAPAAFCRLMDIVMSGLKWQGVLVFVDDILVYTKTFEEHLQILEVMFERLRAAGLTLKPEKSYLMRDQIHYLGHVITAHGVSPDPDKIRAVRDFPIPKNKTDVRAFLGLTGYYRKFIEKYSYVAKPLNDLTKGDGKQIEWVEGGPAHKAFEELKNRLISSPIMAHPDWDLPFIVQTDACHYGISAILAQKVHGKERVVSYHSKTLTEPQQKWGIPDKEAYAVVWACEKLRPYLIGREFVIQTDHEALKAAFEPGATRILSRWAVRLQEFDYKVEPRSGTVGVNADVLSRYPLPETGPLNEDAMPREINCVTECFALQGDVQRAVEEGANPMPKVTLNLRHRLIEDQKEDEKCEHIIDVLSRPPRNGSEESIQKEYFINDDVLYHIGAKAKHGGRIERAQIVIPRTLRAEVLTEIHDMPLSGHCGRYKTYERARDRFYWDGMYKDVKRWVDVCYLCNTRKTVRSKQAGLLHHIAADEPFHTISIDVISFHKSYKGNVKVIVMRDHFTCWAETKAIPDEKADTIADAIFENIITQHGCPRVILTDRGRNFRGTLVRRLCKRMGVANKYTSAYHPQTNTKAERFNRFLAESLTHYLNKKKSNWDDYLDAVTFAYNTSYIETIEESPFFMLYGRDPRLPIDVILGSPEVEKVDLKQYKLELTARLRDAYTEVRKLQAEARAKNKFLYDKGKQTVDYSVNDWVLVWIPVKRIEEKKGIARKLLRRWQGPFRVLMKKSDVNYVVQHFETRKNMTVHVDRMAKYKGTLNDVIDTYQWVNARDPVMEDEEAEGEPV